MSEPLILTEKQDGICLVTLNRPDALNALSSALRAAITEALADLAEDKDTQVIILTGAGRAFTVGLDLKELGGEVDAASTSTSLDLSEAMDRLPQPVIGAVNSRSCAISSSQPPRRSSQTRTPGWAWYRVGDSLNGCPG